jgi:hypothetical protein
MALRAGFTPGLPFSEVDMVESRRTKTDFAVDTGRLVRHA